MNRALCSEEFPLEITRRVRANWLTQKPHPRASLVAALAVFSLLVACFLFWGDFFNASSWMTAIPQNVFNSHEFWRPWTAVFAHADPEHLLSNSLLFSAFAYLLYGHFGTWMFPMAALFFGGVANLIVLTTLPLDANLLGASGVVYWMGAVWLTLYFCLETRDKFSRRALKAAGVGAMFFVPETLHANVSYLCHLVGFLLGVGWALVYYRVNRKRFLQAEVVELIHEDV